MATYEHRIQLRKSRIEKANEDIKRYQKWISESKSDVDKLEFEIFKLDRDIKSRKTK